MKFTKMHGLGNDYIYVNAFAERVAHPADLARRVSDRFTGIGADGLILIAPSTAADVRMEMYNADGSRGRMCGNGIRCVAKYVIERRLAAPRPVSSESADLELTIETDAGVRRVDCQMEEGLVHRVRVDMGRPTLDVASLPALIDIERMIDHPLRLDIARRTNEERGGLERPGRRAFARAEARGPGKTVQSDICSREDRYDAPAEGGIDATADHLDLTLTCVSMGNPHAVCFVEDLDDIDLLTVGPIVEHAPMFPERINFHLARVDTRDAVTMKTWERGSGATRACGTGACAVCVAGAVTGRTERTVRCQLPGGTLDIEWAADDHVYMTGPAVEVFSGDYPT